MFHDKNLVERNWRNLLEWNTKKWFNMYFSSFFTNGSGKILQYPSKPDVLFMQKHWDVMRSDNSGDTWREVSGNLPTDFVFPDRRARPRTGDRLRCAHPQRLLHYVPEGN